jgi:hypothetical protein
MDKNITGIFFAFEALAEKETGNRTKPILLRDRPNRIKPNQVF